MAYNAGDAESGHNEAVLIYDVACQYSISFWKRVGKSDILTSILPSFLTTIYWAVGKFHLGAHKDDCFAQFSLNFLKGIGILDGEILETLWALMNYIAGSASVMSRAHRAETLNRFFSDSNWRKLLRLGERKSEYIEQIVLNIPKPRLVQKNSNAQKREFRKPRLHLRD